MRIDRQSTLIDICFIVCTALGAAGTIVVLSGGSAATFYAPEAYQSRDADFIITLKGNIGRASSIMQELGYAQHGGMYVHTESRFTVEFPPGPLAIGGDLVTTWATIRRDELHLHVLDRTDAVRDRLAAFFFYKDRSALAAAVAIAAAGEVDLVRVRDWSSREGEANAFEEFLLNGRST